MIELSLNRDRRTSSRSAAFTRLIVAPILVLLFCSNASGQSDSSNVPEQEEPTISHRVVMNTSLGEIEFELYGEEAPLTVGNFVALVDSGFYDGILFHRVHPKFVVQAGDPQTKDSTIREKWGTGGTSIYNGPFPDELDPSAPGYRQGYRKGTLAMSNNGPNTNTSQFFVLLSDVPTMPHLYTIFGRVAKGMDVVDSIAAIPLVDIDEYGGTPTTPVKILSTTSHMMQLKQVGSKASDLSKPLD